MSSWTNVVDITLILIDLITKAAETEPTEEDKVKLKKLADRRLDIKADLERIRNRLADGDN